MNLNKISETSTTITLGWTPPVNVQYYLFYANDELVSNSPAVSKNGDVKNSVKFDKSLNPFEVVAIIRNQDNTMTTDVGKYDLSPTPPPTSTKPSIPTGFSATSGDGKVTLSWNPNPSSENVDLYQIYLNDDNYDLNVSGTSYVVSGLTNGTSYGFRVSAHNSAGYGIWTNVVNATPNGATPPPPDNQPPRTTYLVRNTPNYLNTQDAAVDNYQAIWCYGKSPTTPYRSPDSQKQITRYLLLDPRSKDSDGRVGNDEWWFVIERMWPTSYDSSQHGRWGREVNWHNVAGDSGSAENHNGGVGWGFGSGVSALALDWLSAQPSPQFSILTAYRSQGGFDVILPVPPRNEWQTYVLHWIAGRTDGTTVRPGAVTIWANGSEVVRRTNLNTVQRAQGQDGQYYVQKWMSLWEGDYTGDLPKTCEMSMVLTGVGKTFAEAVADRPTVAGIREGYYYDGSGTNDGPPTITVSGERAANLARLPVNPT